MAGSNPLRPAMEDHEIAARFDEYRRTHDRRLRNDLIEAHRWLALVCARRLNRRGEPLDDLVQVAMIGVLKAVERFDPSYGVAFPTFATPTIMGELRRHFRDTTWRVKVPRRLQELHLELGPAVERLTQSLGRAPTPADLASCLGVSTEDVVDALAAGANYRALSLSVAGHDEEQGSDDSPALRTVEQGFEAVADRDRITKLLARLPHRERTILFLRFFHNRTQSEIAEEVGLSQVHVSRLLRASIAQLRRQATEDDAEPANGMKEAR